MGCSWAAPIADQADEETGAPPPPTAVEPPEKTGPEQVAVVA